MTDSGNYSPAAGRLADDAFMSSAEGGYAPAQGRVESSGSSSEPFGGWLAPNKWENVTTGQPLTFSFPDSHTHYGYTIDPGSANADIFVPLPADQRAAARLVFADLDNFTLLDFQEVTESATTTAELRLANQSGLGGAYAYYPFDSETAGDSFYGSGTAGPVVGNEAYLFLTHELGHNMGLGHGHEVPGFGNGPLDSQEFTVVTYRDYVGQPASDFFSSGLDSWAQTYMQLDIAALQFLYGANYAASGEVWSGDTTYTFSPTTGEMSINGTSQGPLAGNRIFRTIWDGDGTDTYDLSNYSDDLEIDLGPGNFSTFSETQIADLDRYSSDPARMARGNVANARLVEDDLRALIENAIGGPGDDSLVGNIVGNHLVGNAGNDTLRGNNGPDTLDGGADADTLHGGGGNDSMIGGPGDDYYVVETTGDRITELSDEGADTVFSLASYVLRDNSQHIENLTLFGPDAHDGTGNGLDNRIEGTNGANVLNGAYGDDTLIGNGGDDIFSDDSGADRQEGGYGNDRFDYDDPGDTLVELPGQGVDTVVAWINAALRTLGSALENLVLAGAAVNGTGNGSANDITGNALANVLYGANGADTLRGGAGDDTLRGENGPDLLLGGADDDLLDGGAAADVMAGGDGDDRFIVGDAADVVYEAPGEGSDTVESAVSYALRDHTQHIENLILTGAGAIDGTGNGLANTITGNIGANVLNGAFGDDTLIGGFGDDRFEDDGGADRMIGGGNDDTYIVDDPGDRIVEGAGGGHDRVESALSVVLRDLSQNVEDLVLTGSANVSGTGNSLANDLTGNAGDNALDGANGADTLTGGPGADRFVFSASPSQPADTITDFDGTEDRLLFAAASFGALAPGALPAGAFHIGTAAADPDDRLVYDDATGDLRYDADGSGAGAAQIVALLSGAPTLGAADVLVI